MLTRNIDKLNFGDIALADLPFTDWSKSKIRPILIVKKDRDDYLLMKVSSKLDKQSDYDISLVPDEYNNLQETSLIKLEKIGVYAKEILLGKLWTLSGNHKSIIKEKLHSFIDDL